MSPRISPPTITLYFYDDSHARNLSSISASDASCTVIARRFAASWFLYLIFSGRLRLLLRALRLACTYLLLNIFARFVSPASFVFLAELIYCH